jgi:hypothetical protein
MLITLIAMQVIWRALRRRQQAKLARRSLRQLIKLGRPDAEVEREMRKPFWRALLVRYRTDVSLAELRRARTRKAISRLSRISERKPARRYPLRIRRRTYF